MSILKVDTINEKTSGNGVVIPSGQTLDVSAGTLLPSADQVLQVKNVDFKIKHHRLQIKPMLMLLVQILH